MTSVRSSFLSGIIAENVAQVSSALKSYSIEVLDTPDANGQWPLHYAAVCNSIFVAKKLIESGCKVDTVTNKTSKTPLHYASECGNSEIVKLILELRRLNANEEKETDVPSENKFTPSSMATHLCAAKDISGNTPLHCAAANGRIVCAMLLLQAGADVNALNNSNMSPLDLACEGNHIPVSAFLVYSGALLDKKDSIGVEPFMRFSLGMLPSVQLDEQTYAPPSDFDALLSSGTLFDIVLSGVPAHKCVLAAKVPLFATYFAKHKDITTLDICSDPIATKVFLECVYYGDSARLRVPMCNAVSNDTFIQLLGLTLEWGLNDITERVSRILSQYLTESSLLSLWSLLASFQKKRQENQQENIDSFSKECLSTLCPFLFPFLCTMTVRHLVTIGGTTALKKILTRNQISELVEYLVLPDRRIPPKPSSLSIVLEDTLARAKAITLAVEKEKALLRDDEVIPQNKPITPKSTRRITNENEIAVIKRIINKLMKTNNSRVFNHPVDPIKDGATNYFEVIKEPMDFKTIKQRVIDGRYQTFQQFASDVQLVFDNALTFNPSTSFIAECVQVVRAVFLKEWESTCEEFGIPFEPDQLRETEHRKEHRTNKTDEKLKHKERDKEQRKKHAEESYRKKSDEEDRKKRKEKENLKEKHKHRDKNRRKERERKEKNMERGKSLKRKRESISKLLASPKDKEKRRIPSDLLDECKRITDGLLHHQFATLFDHPVDPERDSAPNYYSIIKRPMDLGSVRQKLRKNLYRSVQHFISDVRLIWQNSRTFNPPESIVNVRAQTLSDIFEKEIQVFTEPKEIVKKHKHKHDQKDYISNTESEEEIEDEEEKEDEDDIEDDDGKEDDDEKKEENEDSEMGELAQWLVEHLAQLPAQKQAEAVKLAKGEISEGVGEVELNLADLDKQTLEKLQQFVVDNLDEKEHSFDKIKTEKVEKQKGRPKKHQK